MEKNNHPFHQINERLESCQKHLIEISVTERVRMIKKLRRLIAERADEIAKAIEMECHRPRTEAMMQEVLPTLEMATYCEKHFPQWLESKPFKYWKPGFLRKKNYLIRRPVGPVVILAPSNFPFSLPMMCLIYLFLAGNAVFLKLSENSMIVGPLIRRLIMESGIASEFSLVEMGDPEFGEFLISLNSVKKVVLFGSAKTGKRVKELCKKYNKQSVLELGGGVTAVVTKDANLKLAAEGIAWSALYANASSCVGTRRIIIHENVREAFIPYLKEAAAKIESGIASEKSFDKYFGQSRIENLKQFCRRAEERQHRLLFKPNNDYGLYLMEMASYPAAEFEHEIDGPLVRLVSAKNLEELIKDINLKFPSLGVSIWDDNTSHARNIAKSINTKMIWVNDTSVGLPNLIWGGSGYSGTGSVFSEHSLDLFTELKWVSVHPGNVSFKRFWWYPYTQLKNILVQKAARWLYKW